MVLGKKQRCMTNSVEHTDCMQAYTQRQRSILTGIVSLDEVKETEISLILLKAEKLGDIENYEIALAMSLKKMNPEGYYPRHSIDESKALLQNLTPWGINWGDDKE